ncbi:MAG: hypothetical protein D6694_04680 [Gammaproteobacteria bacterium]|nr:MAG: hypothetical protein D6694_04680 [Gammaproteobacteria bacterium]
MMIERLRRLVSDFEFYAPRCLRIKNKPGEIVPLNLNRAQQYIHRKLEEQRKKTGRVRALILKGRQQGCSTYIGARFYHRASTRPGRRVFILTHEAEATKNLFAIVKRFHEHNPIRPETGADSANELTFPLLDSEYKVGTAGNKAVGRSSTIQLFHGSEVAFWPNAAEHTKGVLQAVPDEPGTEIALESTANGIGNFFHEQCILAQAGESEYQLIFTPWFWQPEYRKQVPPGFEMTADEREYAEAYGLDAEQIYWRRCKIRELSAAGGDGEMAFRQEYPATVAEAFLTSGSDRALIGNELAMTARHADVEDVFGPYLVGVDPARFGSDRTAFIRRKGRRAFRLEYHSKLNTMEVVGRVVRIIRQERPDRVFVDVVGIGAGVVDRLREMNYGDIVRPVNGGERALDSDRYANRRTEMWCLMKKWLEDQPARIPDNDALHADLCGPQYSFDSKGRIVLERKEDMQRRGIRSPDGADALAATFYEPVAITEERIAAPPPASRRVY